MLGIADQIAEEHLNLVRVKDDFIAAACPFHKGGQERKPSFWINRTTGGWGCFTCQEGGGDLKYLLKQLGVSSSKIEAELDEARKDSHKAIKLAKVKAKKKARADFKGESILPEALLGIYDFLPQSLLDKGYTEEALGDHDIGYDKHNDKITFPVRDIYGNLVGISGRATYQLEGPKYKFYGGRHYRGREEVLGELGEWCPGYSNATVRDHLWRGEKVWDDLYNGKFDQLIVVEGFKAALWLVMRGWYHVVATMGTKMTPAQERIIRRLGVTVFCFADNNQPGRDAAKFWSSKLANSSFPVYRVHYPEHCDEDAQPDDLSEQELTAVLSSSERVGGSYVFRKRMARKPSRRHEEKFKGRW